MTSPQLPDGVIAIIIGDSGIDLSDKLQKELKSASIDYFVENM